VVPIVVAVLLKSFVVEGKNIIRSNPRRGSIFFEGVFGETISVSVLTVRLPAADGEDVNDGMAGDRLNCPEVLITYTRVLGNVLHTGAPISPQHDGLDGQLPGREVRVEV